MKYLVPSIFLIYIFVASCTIDTSIDNSDCEERIVIETQIPDTTLVLGGEPFRRDVIEEPIVFRHTMNKQFRITVTTEGEATVARGAGRRNENTGGVTVVQVIALGIGETQINVTAVGGDCSPEVTTSFNVAVVDSSS